MTADITDATFEQEVLQSDQPVLVDFWAQWCGPCKAMAPMIDQLSAELAGRAKVVKIDVDQSPDAAARYGIRGVPTLIVFKGGEAVSRLVGPAQKSQLVDLITKAGA